VKLQRTSSSPGVERVDLILASGSPRRAELLPRLGLPFEVLVPEGVDEEAVRGSADEVATRLAAMKAQSVLARLAHAGAPRDRWIVLGADTVVAVPVEGREVLLGKPADLADARRMLALLAGRTHRVVTGVAVARCDVPVAVASESTAVTFCKLSSSQIEAYAASGDPAGKAGAYGIQSRGSELVESLCGCYYNVVGLPLGLAARLLAPWGASVTCDCGALGLQRGDRGCGVAFLRAQA